MSRAAGQTELQPSRLTEEEQIELAASAARAERAARPRHLLVLAGLLLVAALIALIVSSTRLTAARSSLKFQMQLADSMSEEVASLEQLRAAAATASDAGNDELLTIRSKISQAATAAGIPNTQNLTPENDARANPQRPGVNSVQRLFKYTVQCEELPPLLDWMNRAPTQVPGLEVYQVKLTPRPTDWQLQVTFSRWERAKKKP
jgi:type II secretory pathway component PulM